jgi:hypothetical protein
MGAVRLTADFGAKSDIMLSGSEPGPFVALGLEGQMTDKTDKTLVDSDIQVGRSGRRRFLGLAAAGGTVALLPGQAQAADGDTGSWNDGNACPRGPGGTRTGYTDSDNGSISDASGYGRGRPNTC